MADYVLSSNDRQATLAVRALLVKAISAIPPKHLPADQCRRAVELANSATQSTSTARQAALHTDASFDERLRPRGEAVRANIRMLKIVVPAIRAWQREIRVRADRMMELEDELSDAQMQQQYTLITPFAEAAR